MTKLSTATTPTGTAEDAVVERWRRLAQSHATISCALDKALQNRHGIGVSEFETLDRLVDGHCSKYPMSELAQCSYLSQSALSRTVARLEKEHLVERIMCTNDRRSVYVGLTDAGRELHSTARETHRAVLDELLV